MGKRADTTERLQAVEIVDSSLRVTSDGRAVRAASEYTSGTMTADGRPIRAVSVAAGIYAEGGTKLAYSLYSAGTLMTPDGRPVEAIQFFDAAGAPLPYTQTDLVYGINLSPSGQRMYNNLCAREYWRGDHITGDAYAAMDYPYVNSNGDLVSLPPGIAVARIGIINPGVGSKAWFRLTFQGDGSVVTLETDSANVSSLSGSGASRQFEFYMDMTGDSDPNSGTYLRVNGNPSTPITNVDCREITGPGGSYVDAGTFYAPMIESVKSLGDYVRLMDYQGTNQLWAPSTLAASWASRPTSRRSLAYKNARLAHGTGTSKLTLTMRTAFTQDAQAELLATYLPNDGWNGVNGNNWTLTIATASGAGSVSVVGKNITVTPASGAANANAIKAQLDANATTSKILSVTSGGSGAVATLAATNFAGGYDGAQGGYWPDITELITLIGKPAWVHIPYLWDSASAASAAAYVKANVPASCWPCTFEKGNEHWNYSMAMMRVGYTIAIANGRTGANSLEKTLKEYVARATADAIAIKAAAPGAVTVLGAQSANKAGTTDFYLTLPNVNSANINHFATAPYFYPDGTKPDNDDAGYFASAYVSINAKVLEIAAHDASLASTGITQVMYEGSQHDDTSSVIATAQRRQRSTEMGAAFSYYFSEMARNNGVGTLPKRFTHFADINVISTSSSGAWNLFEYLGQGPTPKSIAWAKARAGVFYPYFLYPNVPTVAGTRMVTAVLTATVPTAYRAASAAYAWLRDGVAISGETGLTYTQVTADGGKAIEFRATLTNAQGDTRVYTTSYATVTAPYTKFVEVPFGSSTFALPGDWPGSGKVHCFGAGGRGNRSTGGTNQPNGGGGGAYACLNSFTGSAGATVNCQMGDEGSQTDTWFGTSSTVLAKAGSNGPTTGTVGGAGGASGSCIGDVKYSGGNGGAGGNSSAGGGGGGCAGPSGVGANGGANSGNDASGGGGGGANAGTAGQAGQGTTAGGRGGNSRTGTVGGAGATGASTAAVAGSNGSGGGGGLRDGIKNGAANSKDPAFLLTAGGTAGPGSGSGGCGGSPGAGGVSGAATNGYGGATGGGHTSSPAAGKGGIVVEYVP